MVSPQVHLVMLPWISRARVELVLIFNFLPYLLNIAFEFKEKINVPFVFYKKGAKCNIYKIQFLYFLNYFLIFNPLNLYIML